MSVVPLSKRDKKRRDVLERLETRHAERWYKREEIYNEAITGVMNYGHQLARDPSHAPALQVPLYMLDLQRDATLESIDIHWRYRLESTHRLYELERQKIEDEFKRGREAVRQRLLDQVEERRRKIKEEKDSTGDIVAEALLDAQARPRPTRASRANRRNSILSSTATPEHGLKGPGHDADLAALVANADSLVAALLPSTLSAVNTENIISPLPYSLAVLPAPSIVDKGVKPGRRPGRGQPATASATDASGKPNEADTPPAWRGPTLTGYAKVQGWYPGQPLDALKNLVTVNEMERERDLSAMKGYGRRSRQK